MASYHCSVKNGSVGYGKNHYLYICREKKYEGKLKYEELIDKKTCNLPSWAENNPAVFWSAADVFERINGRAYKEIEIALPNELTEEQNKKFVEDYCQKMFGDKHVYSYAIHNKDATLNKKEKNIHAHIMFCEREIDKIRKEPLRHEYFARNSIKKNTGEITGGFKKNRYYNSNLFIANLRVDFANYQNKILQENNINVRVSSESLRAQRENALAINNLKLADFFDREVPKRQKAAIVYKYADKINQVIDKKLDVKEIDNPEARKFAQAILIREAKKEILFNKVVKEHSEKEFTGQEVLQVLNNKLNFVSDNLSKLEKQKNSLTSSLQNENLYTKKAYAILTQGESTKLLEQIRSKKSLIAYNQEELIKNPDNKETHQEYINKFSEELKEATANLEKLADEHSEKTVNDQVDILKLENTSKIKDLQAEITKFTNINNKLLTAKQNISYQALSPKDMPKNYTVSKEKEASILKIIDGLGEYDYRDISKQEVIALLNDRLKEINTKLLALEKKEQPQAYTKQAYDILTQGESTKILEQIRSKKSLIAYNESEIIKNPDNKAVHQEYINKFNVELKEADEKLDAILAKYPDEEVSKLEQELLAQSGHKKEKTALLKERATIKSILSDKSAFTSAFNKAFDDEYKGKAQNIPTLEKIQQKSEEALSEVKNLASKILAWDKSAVLRGKSEELEKKSSYEMER